MNCKVRLALVGYLLARSWIPNNWGCLLSQLWLELEAWPSCSLESTGTGGWGWGGGGVDEMQNKAEAQPAWAAAGSLAAAGCLGCSWGLTELGNMLKLTYSVTLLQLYKYFLEFCPQNFLSPQLPG